MERVLVTGATGFIGYEVARQLAARGLRPRLTVRRPERGRLLAPLEFFAVLRTHYTAVSFRWLHPIADPL